MLDESAPLATIGDAAQNAASNGMSFTDEVKASLAFAELVLRNLDEKYVTVADY